MNKYITVSAVALATAALCATSCFAAKDNFNRTSLGKQWVIPNGSLFITKNELQGDDMSIGYDKKSSGDSTVSVTVRLHGANLEYGAVTSGDVASGNYAFVKIQSGGDGKFGYGAFYVGNNGAGTIFTLDSAVPSPARLSVSFCGTVAKMKISSAAGVQKYTHDYGTSFSTGGGLGTYGPVSLDGYKSVIGGGCKFDKGAKVIAKSTAEDISLQN